MKKLSIVLILSFLCLAFSYNNGLKSLILNKLSKYSAEQYPEKVYIQTDKPYYTAGESIWFNTYLVNGVTHKVSEKSKVIYVELINEKDSIISERKLFTETLSVSGDFKLPIDLKDGTYLLRAFTNYMRNQPQAYFYKKEIPVFALYADKIEDSVKTENIGKIDSKNQENLDLPEIGFYPEGGYLVNGIKNKVAVKIKGADLSASPMIGIIEDTEGNKITDFNTFEFGLGSFYLIPESGKKYRAVITSGDEDILYSLPASLSEGYVMNTSVTDKEVVIKITTNKKEGLKNTLVIGQQRGLAAFDYTQDKSTNTMLLRIPKKDLIEGVLDIVLFNESTKPVTERLVYIEKNENISISVKKENNSPIGLRENVNLEIEVKDTLGRLIPSTLSLSITDANLIRFNSDSENIETWLLLNSDLKGQIKSSNYFFTKGNSIKKNLQLDLIMLTQGWSRFIWQELLENSLKQEFKPEDGIYITGRTLDAKSPFQNKSSETKLTFRKKGFYQESKNTEKYGYFSYGPFVFNDTINAFLLAGDGLSSKKPNYDDTNILLDTVVQKPTIIPNRVINPFNQNLDIVNNDAYTKKTRSNVFRDFELDQEREKLDEVHLKVKVKTKEELKNIERNKRTRTFAPSHRIIVDEMGQQGAGDFLQLISNVPGIRIGKPNGARSSQDLVVTLRGLVPSFYINNLHVDLAAARSLRQADIDFVDIRNVGPASAIYGLKATGVIAIYTKRGSRDGVGDPEKRPGSISFKSAGFYTAREFYSPDYSSKDTNISREDTRTTLYWKPNIYTTSNENAMVNFYTNDERGKFRIEIEGITESGIPIHKTAFLEVE